jgi:regulator of sigma E protease
VFIHEYGHYYFAKKYGVGVTDFSIGFGKEIYGWNDKSGTRWKICWIPLGGYVKFFGDRNVYSQADHQEILEKYSEEDQQKLFTLKPLYQRALIVFGGPLANFILALVIFFSIYTFIGKDFTPAVINEVQKDSPAMVGGLKQDDIILEIDGNEVKSIMDVSKYITMSTDDFIDFKVKRSYDEFILKVKPDMVLSEDNLGNQLNKRMVGIKLGAYNDEINHIKLGPAQAIYHAAHEVYYVSISSLKYIGGMIAGKADTSQLGGPIRIAKISGQVADVGILAFISMMAYISISLGLINLFPIPMLDGGHLMFYGIEKVLGRPLSQKTQEGFFRIGMFLLLSLMFFTTFNDLKDLGLFR